MKWRVSVHYILMATLVAGAFLGGLYPGFPSVAQAPLSPASGDAFPHITVVGRATVNVTPDVAQASIGVETTSPEVSQALAQNAEAMDAVLVAIQKVGVAAADIQTLDFSVFQEQPLQITDMPPEPIYRVRNLARVIIRNPERAGEVIGAAVDAGANQVFGITFERADTTEAEAEAREMAIADARQRAEALASLAGASLGELVGVSEVMTSGFSPFVSAVPEAGGAGGPGIVPGQMQFSTTVQVTYALDLSGTVGAPTPDGTQAPSPTPPATATTPEASPTPGAPGTVTPEGTVTPDVTGTAAPDGTATPAAIAIDPNPAVIPHELEGRDDCLLCHHPETGIEPAPENHIDFTVEQCQTCHKPGVDGPPEPEVPETISMDLCLFCHGPYDALQARTESYQVSERVTANPHQYVPHESTDPADIPDCENCHEPHPLPVTDEVTVEEADIRWCFGACHHTGTLNPCSDCH